MVLTNECDIDILKTSVLCCSNRNCAFDVIHRRVAGNESMSMAVLVIQTDLNCGLAIMGQVADLVPYLIADCLHRS
jgi:hypothetical protein